MNHKTSTGPDTLYPKLARRLRAALLDVVIFVCVFFGFGFTLAALNFPGTINALVFATAVLILEPALVCVTGGSIGHHALGLRIQDKTTGKNLNPFFALVRFLLKSLIGWLSFAFVLVTKRHQAIHDIFSTSVVVIKNPNGQNAVEGLAEREIYSANFEYPPWYQRVFILVLYVLALFIFISIFMALTLSEKCINQGICTSREGLLEIVVSFVWIGLSIYILVCGWTGRLFGARRTEREH